MALLAGNDILLFSEDVEKAIDYIKEAVSKQKITEEEIIAKCKKVLQLKKWLNLDSFKPLDTKDLAEKINSRSADLLNRRLVENALTLAVNDSDAVPVKGLNKLNIASVKIDDQAGWSSFQQEMDKYALVKHFTIGKK